MLPAVFCLSRRRSGQIGKRDAAEELAADIDLERRGGDDNAEVDGLLIEVQQLGKGNLAAAVGGVDHEPVVVLCKLIEGLAQEGHGRDPGGQGHGVGAVLRNQPNRGRGPVIRRSGAGISRGDDRNGYRYGVNRLGIGRGDQAWDRVQRAYLRTSHSDTYRRRHGP